MPDWEDEYNRAVLRARNSVMNGNGRTAEAFLQIYRMIGQSLIDLDNQLSGVTELRRSVVRRNIGRMIEAFRAEIPQIIDSYRDSAMRRAVESHIEGIERAMAQAGVSIPQSSYAGLQASRIIPNALEYYPIRQGLGSQYNYKSLMNLRIADLQDDVDRLIGSALNRGISSNKLTKELAVLMSKNDKDFQRVLRNLGPRGGRILNGMRDIDPNMLPRAKKFLYNARRIAVSEINNAYNEADRLASEESPVVEYNRWQVSGRHYTLPSTPDACTFNYETDQYGLGEGVFYLETTPSLMHPFCGCYTMKVLKSPDDWLEPDPEPEAPRTFNERGYRRMFKGKTTAHRNRAIDTVNNMNDLAYEFYQRRAMNF